MGIKNISLITALVLSGSLLAGAEVTNLQCDQTGPTEYKLSYSFTSDTHTVRISASTDATGENALQKIVDTSETSVTVHAGAPGQRVYFFLKPDHGRQREVSIRHIALQGTPNFRDVGGYETEDGRFVRWGVLYRSGVLSGLTASDFEYLSQLGVKVVCDFRTPQENSLAPEKWIDDPRVVRVAAPIGSKSTNNKSVSLQVFLAGNPTPEELRARMLESYRNMVIDGAPEFAIAFHQLASGPLPMLYHCTAGKDRTGIFSALVLRSLGVPEATILSDYTLTDKYLDAEGRKQMAIASNNHDLDAFAKSNSKVLLAADPEWIRGAFRAIDQQYGSFDNYRRQVLNVSDDDLEKVKAKLLTM